jgi:hypothetical protein
MFLEAFSTFLKNISESRPFVQFQFTNQSVTQQCNIIYLYIVVFIRIS